MKILLKLYIFIPLLLIIAFFLGPKPKYPPYNTVLPDLDIPIEELDDYIATKEKKVENLRPDNEARVLWADSVRKTPYAIVYIHGFSSSQEEGDPVHETVAKRYGMNMYLHRMVEHGVDDIDSFAELTPKDMVDSAKEAIAIGQLIGEKVIVMGTSTGCTLAVYLAGDNPDAIHAMILYSPNLKLKNPLSFLLTYPWGEYIAYQVNGKYFFATLPEEAFNYWTKQYRIEGPLALQYLIQDNMTSETFQKIEQPLFVGYYYKNEEEQDFVVETAVIPPFVESTSTPDVQKRLVAFPDVGTHVMPCYLQSKDLESVKQETFKFIEEVIGIQAIE